MCWIFLCCKNGKSYPDEYLAYMAHSQCLEQICVFCEEDSSVAVDLLTPSDVPLLVRPNLV